MEIPQEELLRLNKNKEQVEEQILLFAKGFNPIKLKSSCSIESGDLLVTSAEMQDYFCGLFENALQKIEIVKFVPASGAASRMFKHLFQFDHQNPSDLVVELMNNLRKLPFYDDLTEVLSTKNISLSFPISKDLYPTIADAIVNQLNYGNIPKGKVPFHKYEDHWRNAFQEHLHEAIEMLPENSLKIHFTVSKDYLEEIKKDLLTYAESTFPDKEFDLSYSIQHPETDTVAVDLNNVPVRDKQGNLIFRPGGHGSLIHNLNGIDADLVFIKNIDNVVPDSKRSDTSRFKKIIGGIGIGIQQDIFLTLKRIENEDLNRDENFDRLLALLGLPEDLSDREYFDLLNRPLRICGMVLNQGEPGGGPFRVWNDDQSMSSRQIVEKAQVNLSDPSQLEILNNSTHFNPVDLVCFVRDYQGNKFNLLNYVDQSTSFITEKSVEGQTVKALEHPGLWNGAMAYWNTIFVEVPLTTFNPVKTINDLCREMHQA